MFESVLCKTCRVEGLKISYTTHVQTYVVLEVKYVVLEVYDTQQTYIICCV